MSPKCCFDQCLSQEFVGRIFFGEEEKIDRKFLVDNFGQKIYFRYELFVQEIFVKYVSLKITEIGCLKEKKVIKINFKTYFINNEPKISKSGFI